MVSTSVMHGLDTTGLLHLLGFVTGAALYALLLVLALRSRGTGPADYLPLATAVLGLTWNLGATSTWLLTAFELPGGTAAISAVSYAALGLLPAAVVHAVLRRDRDDPMRTARTGVIAAAWSLSVVGAGLQVIAALTDARVGNFALLALTLAYVALSVPLFVLTRRQPNALRSWWIVALAVFAISGLHLSTKHLGDYAFGTELLGHHASLPLAFAILVYDYRFAFADIFLKRAIALVTLVASVSAAVATVGLPILRRSGEETVIVAIVVLFAVSSAAVYPWIRRLSDAFVDRVLLGRHDQETFRLLAAGRMEMGESVDQVLDELRALIAAAFSARVEWREIGEEPRSVPVRLLSALSRERWNLLIPTTEHPRFAFAISGLPGGRTFLSDDEALLTGAAIAAARRIDGLRLTNERVERETREQNLRRLSTEAELRALRAQINPHFLFNALNTVGYLIRTSPERAYETLIRLTGLLRRVLRSQGAMSTLSEEKKLVEAYLDIERERFEERLSVEIDVPDELSGELIPAFLLQPLVENAVKHGVEESASGATVSVTARTSPDGGLLLRVADSGPGTDPDAAAGAGGDGIGLENIRRRLTALYGDDVVFRFNSEPGKGTMVEVEIPSSHQSRAGAAS